MFTYPAINPVFLEMGPLKIYWYGLMYLIAFVGCWFLMRLRANQDKAWGKEDVSDLLFYAALGVVLGGRLGYMLFYNFHYLFSEPLSLFRVWDGGMSFHGGFLGVLFAFWYFARKTNKGFIQVSDFVAPVVPLGLAAGRIGNFINGELWGRATDVPWAMIYPHVDHLPRHPSQIYECMLEGVFLFLIMWFYSKKTRPAFSVSALFLFGYGSFRFFAEFFREPDAQFGFIAFDWLTMGQLLTLPMLLLGVILVYRQLYGGNK